MQNRQFAPNYAALDDSALVRRSQNGDADAYAELYRRYLTPIYKYVFRRVGGNSSVAEDLTSQVFLEALNNLSTYRERGRFIAWLFTITRRRLVDSYRKQETSSLEDVPESLLGISDEHEVRENRNRLKHLLSALDEEKRELLRLRFSAELSFADIAAVLGKNEAAVKMSLYRILDGLREQWEVDYE